MNPEGGKVRWPHSWIGWTIPALWAGFVWSYILVLSQLAGQSFLVAIRGTGVVQYSAAIVVLSPEFDQIIFLGLGILVLASHSALLFGRRLDPTVLLVAAGLAVGMAGYLFVSPFFIILVGIAAIATVLEDSSGIAIRTGTTRGVHL